jgi:uncharacterized FlgJ-related protein
MRKIHINKNYIFYISVTITAVGIILFLIFTSIPKDTVSEPIIISEQTNDITHDEVKLYLKQINVKFPEIVYAQTVLETGNYKSNICYENNNICGMKVSAKRPTTAIGSKNGHAYYRTWQESLLDYALYQAYYFSHVKTVDEYLDSLRNYAEDTTYIAKIKQIARQF